MVLRDARISVNTVPARTSEVNPGSAGIFLEDAQGWGMEPLLCNPSWSFRPGNSLTPHSRGRGTRVGTAGHRGWRYPRESPWAPGGAGGGGSFRGAEVGRGGGGGASLDHRGLDRGGNASLRAGSATSQVELVNPGAKKGQGSFLGDPQALSRLGQWVGRRRGNSPGPARRWDSPRPPRPHPPLFSLKLIALVRG